jgi:predicted transcriptional regulator of viral defense system
MQTGHIANLTKLARRMGVLRSRDLAPHNIPRHYLRTLEDQGVIRKTGRGLYVAADAAKVTENHTVAEAAKVAPSGVVCLLTALRLHKLTTQAPFEVWMAIEPNAWKPKLDHPPLRIVRFSGKAFSEGIQKRKIEGVEVSLYSPAKTVADCFKYRNKIGLDVALEALRDCLRKKRATMDEIWRMAAVCRVTNVMRPYMEAIA